MENFLNGGIEELEAAKKAIIDEAEKNLAADEAKNVFKAKEKELNARKMFMSDRISSTIRNRRQELEKEHDEKIEAAKRAVKESRKNKKDALAKAVNQRVKEETSDIVAANKALKKENKKHVREAKMPGFCASKYYYAMFAPRSGADFLVFVLSIVIAAALIPNIVCAIVNIALIFKIILYVAIVVFFALIYFLISIWTKSGNKTEVLEACRPNMEEIKKNKRAEKKLKRGIKNDGDESRYGLDSLDEEIARNQQIFETLTQDKQTALERFEAETSAQIRKEVEDEIVPQIKKLEEEADRLEAEYNSQKIAAQESSEYLASEYVIYLSERYATCEKIDELIELIKEGKAVNISQALDIAKGIGK